jgi:hypothetical protein
LDGKRERSPRLGLARHVVTRAQQQPGHAACGSEFVRLFWASRFVPSSPTKFWRLPQTVARTAVCPGFVSTKRRTAAGMPLRSGSAGISGLNASEGDGQRHAGVGEQHAPQRIGGLDGAPAEAGQAVVWGRAAGRALEQKIGQRPSSRRVTASPPCRFGAEGKERALGA